MAEVVEQVADRPPEVVETEGPVRCRTWTERIRQEVQEQVLVRLLIHVLWKLHEKKKKYCIWIHAPSSNQTSFAR